MYIYQSTCNTIFSLVAGAAIGGGLVYLYSKQQRDREFSELTSAQEKKLADLSASHESEIADLEEAHQEALTESYNNGYNQGISDAADAADEELRNQAFNPEGLRYAIIDGSDPAELNQFFMDHPDAREVKQPGGRLPKNSTLMWFAYKP